MPPGVAFEEMSFRAFRGNGPPVSGEASRASLRRDTTALEAEGLRIRLPGRPGEADLLLAAPEGRGNLRERWLEVRGGTVLTQGSLRCETEGARWDGAVIRGSAPVRIQGPGFVARGPGFVLDPEAGNVRITGSGTLDVRGAR